MLILLIFLNYCLSTSVKIFLEKWTVWVLKYLTFVSIITNVTVIIARPFFASRFNKPHFDPGENGHNFVQKVKADFYNKSRLSICCVLHFVQSFLVSYLQCTYLIGSGLISSVSLISAQLILLSWSATRGLVSALAPFEIIFIPAITFRNS